MLLKFVKLGGLQLSRKTISWVQIFLGANFPGGNCRRGSYSGWEFSGWELFWVGIFRVGLILGRNFLWWKFSGWQFSGIFHVTNMKKAIQTIKPLRLKDDPISYNVINAIAKGIVVANDRTMLVEHGGHLKFTDNWARNVLNEVQRSEKKMVKGVAATSKIPIAPGLLNEEQLTFQRKIQALVKRHDIPEELVLNFDQTPFSTLLSETIL